MGSRLTEAMPTVAAGAGTLGPMALILVREASERYGISGRRIRALLLESAIAGSKVATAWLVDEDSLKRYLESDRRRPRRQHPA